MKGALAVGLGLLLLAGCSRPPSGDPGPLAIAIVEYGDDAPQVVCLASDYGFLVKWEKEEPPELYVYRRRDHRITCPADFAAFLAELERLPTGARVDQIHRCCASFDWGMPDAERRQLHALLVRKQFRLTGWQDGNFTICTCESRQLRLLKQER